MEVEKKITVTVVGLGLIGGSMAISLKNRGYAAHVIGVDASETNRLRALEIGVVDQVSELDQAVKNANVVILAIPVDRIVGVLQSILDQINDKTVVIDTGSTKSLICESVKNHPNRGRYVAVHPIAGTENSGPDAALDGLFDDKVSIICDSHLSNPDAIAETKKILEVLNMRITEMDSKSHDLHIAYVSHLSHITSFMLGKTVLEMEKDENNIFDMAGSGFESTVRLAKSSPDMWMPIFAQNSKNVSAALDKHIKNLQAFKTLIDNNESSEMYEIMKETNKIRRVLDGIVLTKR
ncbi:prephenate dehydrogenase [Bacteroidota bacterium]